jgi:D-3-phosphoglycerate dehydrogenase
MINKSRGNLAYTLVDVDGEVPEECIDRISSTEGVLAVRAL